MIKFGHSANNVYLCAVKTDNTNMIPKSATANYGNIGNRILLIGCPNENGNTPNVLDSLELRAKAILFNEEGY